jgi:hypothetical protein
VGTLGLDSILLAEGRVLNLLLDPEVTYLTSRGGGGATVNISDGQRM